MYLPSLILSPSAFANGGEEEEVPDPLEIFTSALGNIFTDDAQNMHGDPGTAVIYRSPWRRPDRRNPRPRNRSRSPSRRDNAANLERQAGGKRGLDGMTGPDEENFSRGTATTTKTTETGALESASIKPITQTKDSRSSPGDILLRLADPAAESGRRLFAHYLWNASLLVADLIGRADDAGGIHSEKGLYSGIATSGTGTTAQSSQATVPSILANTIDDCPNGEEDDYSNNYLHKHAENSIPYEEEDISPPQLGPSARMHDWSVAGETVLELGAGSGLAGIVAVLARAKQVTITDYPAAEVLANIQANVDANVSVSLREKLKVYGHQWGVLEKHNKDEEHAELQGEQQQSERRSEAEAKTIADRRTPTPLDLLPVSSAGGAYTRVIAADCLWLKAEHANLARSMAFFLSRDDPRARVWVVAGFHTGRRRVAAFFDELAQQGELAVEAAWQVDTNLRERAWPIDGLGRTRNNINSRSSSNNNEGDDEAHDGDEADQPEEDAGERKKWLLVALLKRRGGI